MYNGPEGAPYGNYWVPPSLVGIPVQRTGGGTLWKLLGAAPFLLGSWYNGAQAAPNSVLKEQNMFVLSQKILGAASVPVSYTHLTLPTILRV